jgi:N utilization substance protein B
VRRSDQRRDAVFASYQRDVTGRPLEELIAESRPLTREIAEGVDYFREELDDEIEAHAKGWAVDRLAPLDLNVMRVALYEIEYTDVPAEVAIDEAVEIAKEYCGADAPGFINGILGAIVRERAVGSDGGRHQPARRDLRAAPGDRHRARRRGDRRRARGRARPRGGRPLAGGGGGGQSPHARGRVGVSAARSL